MSIRMSTPTIPILTARNADLVRQLRAEQLTTARLRAELAAVMLPYQGHTALVVDGVLTIVLHSGPVYQRVQRTIDRPGESGWEWHWQECTTVPTSPAARISAAVDETVTVLHRVTHLPGCRRPFTECDCPNERAPDALVRHLEATL